MGKVILKGFIVVPEDELNIVSKALEKHVALTKQEPGCLVFNVNQRSHSPVILMFMKSFLTIMLLSIIKGVLQHLNGEELPSM